MNLYVSDDVMRWCRDASAGIIENKARITSEQEVIKALNRARNDPKTIIHAGCGHTLRYNKFGLVLKESNGSALVMDLPRKIIQDDGYGQAGTEVPDLHDDRRALERMGTLRRLKKLPRDAYFRFSDVDQQHEFYTTWSQEPEDFYGD